jgi:hypothetical protein
MTATRLFSFVVLLLAGACSKEEYGFVARLGDDTTSIEWITRTRNHITSDLVERSPRVMRKHWEATLDADGSLRSWTMNKQILNPRAGEGAEITYRMDFAGDSVIVTERGGPTNQRYRVTDALPVTVPWESYIYGLYELLFARALAQSGDSVAIRQYIPGQGLVRGVVRKPAEDSLTLVTGGLAGTGVARLDTNGGMTRYSGRFTTYKHEVERVTVLPDLDAIAQRFAEVERRAPARSLSVRDTARYRVGTANITIDYSRPLRRGRNILGNVVPFGVVWRTGANAATQLTVDAPVTIAGMRLTPGTYTLWTLPDAAGTQLIINRQHGQWGTQYNPQRDLGRAAVQATSLAAPIDTFTIRIDGTALLIEWDRFRWSVPVAPR